LHRYGRQAQIEISCNVSGISSGTFQSKYLQKIQSQLPEGISLSLGGMNQMMQKSMVSLIQAIVLSILFLYLVMAAQFESFIDPVAIMFALPLAIIGALLGLFIFGSEISMTALIGIVMLMGLVSKNGILLIDAAKERMNEGMPIRETLKEAGLVRLRPIIMTTLAMIFGMIPSAVSTSSGSEMSAPMSQAIIGGLITSTILTLFVVPIAYTILDDLKNKLSHKKSSKAKEELNQNL
jgi:multidrug efflux pump subunit AcrB